MHLTTSKGSSTGSASVEMAKRWRIERMFGVGLRTSGRGEASHGAENISGRLVVAYMLLQCEIPGNSGSRAGES